MAIEKLGIHPNKSGASIGDALAIHPTDSAPALKFRFATQSNSWLTANVWATVDIVRKAGNEAVNGYANIGDGGSTGIARSSFTLVGQEDGAYIYEIALTDALMDDVETLLGTLTYSGRSYDAIRLTLDVRVVWGAGANDYTKSSQVCYIGFKPTYTATGAQYGPQGLEITYTASGWSRPNDRWANNALTCGTAALADDNAAWGTVGGAGKIVIPADKLKMIPATGDTLGGSIRMVGSWQGTGAELGTLDLTGVSVTNLTTIKKPTITATAQTNGVLVKWTGTTGTGTTPTRVEVSMEDGGYAADRWTFTAVNETHLFKAVPSGVKTDWQAVGIGSVGGVEYASGPTNVKADEVYHYGLTIVPERGSTVVVQYNATMGANAKPESETVKLAGRERPTVGYGEGGTATWSIGGDIVATAMGGLSVTDPADVLALPFGGVCVVCSEDGARRQVAISDASVSRPIGGGGGLRSVSISAEEVA